MNKEAGGKEGGKACRERDHLREKAPAHTWVPNSMPSRSICKEKLLALTRIPSLLGFSSLEGGGGMEGVGGRVLEGRMPEGEKREGKRERWKKDIVFFDSSGNVCITTL